MKQISRLQAVKKFIFLTKKNGHIFVEIKRPGFRLQQLTNVHDRLSQFEQGVMLIHLYRLFAENDSHKVLKKLIEHLNYAAVFGSPWELLKENVA
jgi:hypothetical protein